MCAINAFYFINTNFYMRIDICIKYVYLRTKKRTRIYAESSRKTISLFFSFLITRYVQVTLTIYVTIYVTQEHLVIFIPGATNSLDSRNVVISTSL